MEHDVVDPSFVSEGVVLSPSWESFLGTLYEFHCQFSDVDATVGDFEVEVQNFETLAIQFFQDKC